MAERIPFRILSALAVLAAVFVPASASAQALIHTDLERGSTGDEVRLLQSWLSENQEIYPEGAVTGAYDAATERAVKRYQEERGMILSLPSGKSAYGSVGAMTRANLNADFSDTKGGIAAVERPYGDALVFEDGAFVPVTEIHYLADKPVRSRMHLWVYPATVTERAVMILKNANGYSVGLEGSGRIYGKTPTGKAATAHTYVVPEAWQHISVIFTDNDAVFIYNNKVVETVAIDEPEFFFFSGFFKGIADSLKSFSFFSPQGKGESSFVILENHKKNGGSESGGWFDGVIAFVSGLFGGKSPEREVPAPSDVIPPTTEPVVQEEPEPEPPPVVVTTETKPPPKPLIPPIFAPATTTVVTPIASTTVSTSTASSTSPTASTTAQVATSTVATTTATTTPAPPPPVVFIGGTAPVTNQKPAITLSGSSEVTIGVGTIYTDPGATASDPEDGNVSSAVIVAGTVDHLIPGTYQITYNVVDSKGLAANTVTRTVTVTPPSPLPEDQQQPEYSLAPAGQPVAYTVSSGEGLNPTFVSTTIDPLHVYVGQTQTLTVTVSSPGGVASVQAVTELDTTTLTLDLVKQNESGDTATFSKSWVVYDTHVREYRTRFTATANSGATNSMTMAWSDPCAGIVQGSNSSTANNCTLGSTEVYGLDGGTVTINHTVTLGTNSTWAWNPGTSIILGTGSMVKGSGAQLRKGYLFYVGADNNSANTCCMAFFTTTPQTGYVRVSTYAQTFYYSEGFYCLAPDTMILMADGGKRKIKDVRIGDIVVGQSEEGTTRPNIVVKTFVHDPWENEYQPFKTLKINGRIVTTAEHPFMTGRGFVQAGDLKVGDIMIGVLKPEKIISVEKGPALSSVYNLEVFPDHSYFADEVLVHNKFHHDVILPP